MPPIIPDLHPWAMAALIVFAILGASLPALGVAWIKVQAERHRTAQQVADIHHQTVNDHTDQANLREQVDEVHRLVIQISGVVDRLEDRNKQHDRELARLADGGVQQAKEMHDFSNRIHKRFDWFMDWAKDTFRTKND